MAKRDFHTWLSKFRYSIADFGYYIDFNKVYKNVDSIKIELNILNSLIGSKNIESDFEKLIAKYPETLKCIPILLAVREYEIFAGENGDVKLYTFDKQINTVEEYKLFMKKTGLFELLSNYHNHIGITNKFFLHGSKPDVKLLIVQTSILLNLMLLA